ncbi:hypothetical protein ED28_09575 [[Pantoea] beijingensis]|uniref:Uncharacterized protein n=1 Tax=[Pantoea] beijingensis TaxID=1324864 RepID=A0A443IDA8_9GAMM|nr:hypothetical protein ED28_09575 [[Pantoea] beijingensis]
MGYDCIWIKYGRFSNTDFSYIIGFHRISILSTLAERGSARLIPAIFHAASLLKVIPDLLRFVGKVCLWGSASTIPTASGLSFTFTLMQPG